MATFVFFTEKPGNALLKPLFFTWQSGIALEVFSLAFERVLYTTYVVDLVKCKSSEPDPSDATCLQKQKL